MIRLDRRVLHDRRETLTAQLAQEHLEALVVFAQGSAVGSGSKSHGYMRFLCDWDGYNTNSLLLLIPGHKPVLLVSNIFLQFMATATPWIDDVRFAPPPALGDMAARILRDRLPACTRLAVTGRAEMPVSLWESLGHALGHGVQWTDYESRIDPMRVVKDAMQYGMHFRGAELCDAMFQELRREIRTGKPTCQLQAAVEKVARDAGAEHVSTWLTITPTADYSRFRREECQRPPQFGDQVLLGIYLLYQGHWGHAIRMGTYGKASPLQERAFRIVLDMQNAALDALYPQKNLYDVNRAFEQVFNASFTADEQKGIFRFRDAHGLGHSYEDPIVSAPFPQPYVSAAPMQADARLDIVPGMLFELHPNFFEKGIAGATLGDMVYVGDNGPEIMTQYPREHIRWDK